MLLSDAAAAALDRSLPSLGAWIETLSGVRRPSTSTCRSLHWERGLKLCFPAGYKEVDASLPSLGAWIETPLEIVSFGYREWSLPSLGAWIETLQYNRAASRSAVAPFIGSVD